jgi:hypothetical protein
MYALQGSTASFYARIVSMANRPRHLGILGAVFDREIGANLLAYSYAKNERASVSS